jgi:hypothetical protein
MPQTVLQTALLYGKLSSEGESARGYNYPLSPCSVLFIPFIVYILVLYERGMMGL